VDAEYALSRIFRSRPMTLGALLACAAIGAAGACASRSSQTAAAQAAPAPTPAPVVAAERAFAADGLALGIKKSFIKHSTDDAIILQPGPVKAHETMSKMPDPEPGAKLPQLVWWPLWAGVARSGELGFTTGPFRFNDKPIGHYFTVWKKQPDGSWKWIFDGGVDADPTGQPGPGSRVAYLPLAARGSASPGAAAAEVRAAEDDLARLAASDLPGAYLAYLADDGRMHTDGLEPAIGGSAFPAALNARGAAMEFVYLGGGASRAGDLVWTYGDARWSAGGQPRRGHYVRIWQKREAGWRLVFDQIVPLRT
jgi:ketosteroid isomerase-like protein